MSNRDRCGRRHPAQRRYFPNRRQPGVVLRVQDLRASAGNKINKLRGERRDAAQALHKIQRLAPR